MPNKDGKGPLGQGSGGAGGGFRQGQKKSFSGIGGGAAGQGPSGYCICPSCGIKVEHQPGIPCNSCNALNVGLN